MKILKIFERDSATWIGHSLVAVFGSAAIAVLMYRFLGVYPDVGLTLGALFWLMFYGWREAKDEIRHRVWLKDWREPSEIEGVTPLIDKCGDLLGPATWFVGCLVWMTFLWAAF